MVIKKLAELGRRIDEHSVNFNKEMENIRNSQIEATELKHTITDMKNSLRGSRGRFKQARERINKLGSYWVCGTERKD